LLLNDFIDEIPREDEEAAMVDRYTRLPASRKVVLPQAATAIFCMIFVWNESALAVPLTSGSARTAPTFISIIVGEGSQDWLAVAAGTTIFMVQILVFAVLLRKHLLRGVAFGPIHK
jgi:multiple sugar transport system permease protein